MDWARIVPFAGMHLACLGVIWVGVSTVAVAAAVGLYVLRMFAITGFYHRYFSHRTFKASRGVQFAFACLEPPPSSAARSGGRRITGITMCTPTARKTCTRRCSAASSGRTWAGSCRGGTSRRTSAACATCCATRNCAGSTASTYSSRSRSPSACWCSAGLLDARWPELGTSGGQMLVWGFFISTVACYHGTYTINSLCHVWGRRRYQTGDDSRNNLLLALITLGEGWHNNHHRYPASARQGFYWWEIDLTYYGLRLLAALGLIRDLKQVPARIRAAHTAVTS